MTSKPQTAAQKKAAEKKADEIAELMADSTEPSAPVKEAPPAIKTAQEATDQESVSDQGGEISSADESDQSIKDSQSNDDQASGDDDQLSDDDQLKGDDQDNDDEQGEMDKDQITNSILVVLSKTIHTKDKDGINVKFVASKSPQDLGEYTDMAIKAGVAKVVAS